MGNRGIVLFVTLCLSQYTQVLHSFSDNQTVLCSTSDSESATDKFKAPEPTLLYESDEEKPISEFQFRRPAGYDSSTDEESLLC